MAREGCRKLAEAALPCSEVQVHIDNARASGSTWTLGVVEWGGVRYFGITEFLGFLHRVSCLQSPTNLCCLEISVVC